MKQDTVVCCKVPHRNRAGLAWELGGTRLDLTPQQIEQLEADPAFDVFVIDTPKPKGKKNAISSTEE